MFANSCRASDTDRSPDGYEIEKRPVGAKLLLADGSTLTGRLYLCSRSAMRSGEETIEELVCDPAPFLPFSTEDDRFVMPGKSVISAIKVSELPAADDEALFDATPVQVRLVGNHLLEGDLWLEKAVGHQRFSDRVNQSTSWLRLRDSEGMTWCCRERIQLVSP